MLTPDATGRFVESSYKKAVNDSYVATRLQALQQNLPFFGGTKSEFLQTSFSSRTALAQIQMLATRSLEDLRGISQTMAASMNRTLADGFARGLGPREIARTINAETGIGRQRATRIARTEIVRAYAEGQLDTFETLGVEEVGLVAEWLTAGDDRVCPQCESFEGAIFPIPEARGLIPLHTSCRCAWTPVVSTSANVPIPRPHMGGSPSFSGSAAGYPERYPVPLNKRSWSSKFKSYDPPDHTADVLKTDPVWADPADVKEAAKLKVRPPDVSKPGESGWFSHEGKIRFDDRGRPLNPQGRTGIEGRGKLGKWGPNQAADPIVTRINPTTGDLEMIAIKRSDTGQWAIPGGMVDDGEAAVRAAFRELTEETGIVLPDDDAVELFRGFVTDPRNTDNAWMETSSYHLHLDRETADRVSKALRTSQGSTPDEVLGKRWVPLTEKNINNLYGDHKKLVETMLQKTDPRRVARPGGKPPVRPPATGKPRSLQTQGKVLETVNGSKKLEARRKSFVEAMEPLEKEFVRKRKSLTKAFKQANEDLKKYQKIVAESQNGTSQVSEAVVDRAAKAVRIRLNDINRIRAETKKLDNEFREVFLKRLEVDPEKRIKISAKSDLDVTSAKDFVERLVNRDALKNVEFVEDLEIVNTGIGKRAFARGNQVHVSKTTRPQILPHEIGHVIENSTPRIRRAAKQFRDERVKRAGTKDVKMRDLVKGKSSYSDDEVGNVDGFLKLFDDNKVKAAYTSKTYTNGTTEIISTGLELLYQNPVKFARDDPEFFKFITGILNGTL